MQYKQISVFLENRTGRLAEMTAVLAENNVNIKTISVADTNNFGIVRLIVDAPDAAVSALKKFGFTVKENSVTGIVIDDAPGGLRDALKLLEDNEISVEYVYYLETDKAAKKATIIAKFENPDAAEKIMRAGRAPNLG
ncbi:MAG: ACT domain-containing protein [Defluviitaleaceae bacterium]|nr:ACT domain-containing protein [Defluviitaleaceae bacterium]